MTGDKQPRSFKRSWQNGRPRKQAFHHRNTEQRGATRTTEPRTEVEVQSRA